MKIIGSYVSPYVRKVLACLALKGLAYEIDPITPFYGNEEFGRLSPLRRIPVLVDGDLALCDSSVICAYLDEAYPGPPLLPAAPDGSRPRPLVRGICRHPPRRPLHLGPVLPEDRPPDRLGRARRPGADRRTLGEDLPRELDYLERELPADGWLFGEFGLADIALATFFRNGAYAGFEVDAGQWPRTAGLRCPRARPSRLRRAASLRGHPARDDAADAARGAGRDRCAVVGGDPGHARSAPGRHGALRN